MTRSYSKQRGLSLISLMIALTIGVFLLAGLFAVWFQTRQTFKTQGQLAQLQDSERMALTIMASVVQTAGYYPVADNYSATPPSPLYSTTNVFTVTSPFATAGQSVYGTHAAAGDTLTVRYMADANTLDCAGQSETKDTLVVNQFQLDASGNLTCTVTNSKGAQPAQIIVSGVSGFTVVYGVSTSGSSGSTNEYLTADQLTSAQWTSVRSVNLQLTFTNPLAGQAGQKATLPQITRLVAITQTKTS